MIKDGIKATWPFIIVRLLTVLVVCAIYLFVAAQLQYWGVKLLGESTFNYIITGLLSLFVGVALCSFLGKWLLLLVNGWHIAALPYARSIIRGDVGAVEVGFYSFKEHFMSFGLIMGLNIVVSKLSGVLGAQIQESLRGNSIGNALIKLSKFPIFEKSVDNIVSAAYDCVVYYLVKYTEPGVADDPQGVAQGLKAYVFCLPKMIAASIGVYFCTETLPRIAGIIFTVFCVLEQGIVASIFIWVLVYPIWYLLYVTVLHPLYVAVVLGIYADKCKDIEEESGEQSNKLLQILVSLLESCGIDASCLKHVEEPEVTDKVEEPGKSTRPVHELENRERSVSVPKTTQRPIHEIAGIALSHGLHPQPVSMDADDEDIDEADIIGNSFSEADLVGDSFDEDDSAWV